MTAEDWFAMAKRYAMAAKESPYRSDWLRYATHALGCALAARATRTR